MLIIDSRIREFEKNKLKSLGYSLFEIQPNSNLYYEIASHVDIHCCKIKNNLIVEPSITIKNSIPGNSKVDNKYPLDIPYNVCIIGNKAIHNFKYTDSKIIDILNKNKFTKININQGYSKCSIAVIDENSVIVTDKKIAETLRKYDLEVLVLDSEINKNIHLYKNNNFEYSNMNGFIGGVISRIDNFIFISGDLNKLDSNNKIRDFIEKRNLTIIDFKNEDIIDYGGIINY